MATDQLEKQLTDMPGFQDGASARTATGAEPAPEAGSTKRRYRKRSHRPGRPRVALNLQVANPRADPTDETMIATVELGNPELVLLRRELEWQAALFAKMDEESKPDLVEMARIEIARQIEELTAQLAALGRE